LTSRIFNPHFFAGDVGYFSARQEIDMGAVEQQIMGVWYKSLRDLPDMADLSGSPRV